MDKMITPFRLNTFLIIVIIFSLLISIYPKDNARNKEIQAFYTSSSNEEYINLRYDLLTTIVYVGVDIDENGTLLPSKNYNPIELIRYSHIQKVGVVLMFRSFDTKSADILLANNGIRMLAINNLLNEVKKNNFDGIDIDLENINEINSINNKSNKQLMTDFITILNNVFKESNPNYRISIDLNPFYSEMDRIFDFPMLQKKVNYIMIMGYDWHGTWSRRAGPNSPMNADSGMGIYESIRYYEKFVDKNKLLLGVPWYGYEYATTNNIRLSNRIPNGSVKSIPYNQYINVVHKYGRIWDPVWQTPWYIRKDNTGQWYEGYYDDIKSLGIKYDFVNSENLSGIGIWTVNYGANRSDLWSLIEIKFGYFSRKIG